MTWQEALWAELDEKDTIAQILLTAAWIEEITHVISPALAQRRREKVLEALAVDGMEPTRLAETIGSRRSAVKRLAEEGRANQRERNRSRPAA